MTPASLQTLTNSELLQALAQLVSRDRDVEADLLAHIGEVDARRLFADEGFPSMFQYCVEMLSLSEASAFQRIRAARLGRTYPVLLERVRQGEIHLAAITLLAPHLTLENHVQLLGRSRHRTKREIERFLADLSPKPDVRSAVRKLHDATAARGGSPPPGETPTLRLPNPRSQNHAPEPLGEKRFKIQFTASEALYEKLSEVQALLKHQIPDGELAEIFDRALTLLRQEARRKKFAETSRPRRSSKRKVGKRGASRHIPAEIKRAVVARDGGRCAFVSENGRRCESADLLEFHHGEPWARSRCHSIEGIELRCREHNFHATERDFGSAHMERFRRRNGESSQDSPRQERGLAPGLRGTANPEICSRGGSVPVVEPG